MNARSCAVAQRLKIAAYAALRAFGGGAEHRARRASIRLDRDPREDEPAHHVEKDIGADRAHHHHGQHDERIDAAAGIDAVRSWKR